MILVSRSHCGRGRPRTVRPNTTSLKSVNKKEKKLTTNFVTMHETSPTNFKMMERMKKHGRAKYSIAELISIPLSI